MYSPKHFRRSEPEQLLDVVRRAGAGEVITYGRSGIQSSFVPLLISDDARTVSGHLARVNPQWRDADLTVPALVTWRGPDAYVSPRYYPSKHEHGRVVPTWNYIAVQARGILSVHDDDDWKRAHVEALTTQNERGSDEPWSVGDAPAAFVETMVRAIVGIELDVTELDGKWKLSQNRSDSDVAGVIEGLAGREGPGRAQEVAAEMDRHLRGR